MVNISNIVSLGSLSSIVIDHCEQFVLSLSGGVLAATDSTQHVSVDLQVSAELYVFHNLRKK